MICLNCLEVVLPDAVYCCHCGERQLSEAEAYLRKVNGRRIRDYLGLADDEQPIAAFGWVPLMINMHLSVVETVEAGYDASETCRAAGRMLEHTLYEYMTKSDPRPDWERD